MRKIFLILSLMLPMAMFAQNNDWVGGGYSELEDETATEEGGSFFCTNDRSNYKVLQIGYDNVAEGNGIFASIGWAKNITRKALPLYLEMHGRFVYANFDTYTYYRGKRECNFFAFGMPLYLSYKLKAGKFQLFPITGLAANLLVYQEDGKDYSPDFGLTWDLGFRIGYKKTFLEYKRAFNLYNFGDTHFASLSFVF